MKKNPVINVSDLLDQIKELRNRLLKESDVGGVLISTSFLEACLASLLGVHFVKSKVTEELLNPTTGTLGTFRSKCDVCYCLGLILKKNYQDLLIIGQTRNIFAHNHLKASFEDDDVREKCSKLEAPRYYLESNKDQSNYDDLVEYFKSPKNRFVYTVSCISDQLLRETLAEKSKKIGNESSVENKGTQYSFE